MYSIINYYNEVLLSSCYTLGPHHTDSNQLVYAASETSNWQKTIHLSTLMVW